MFFYEEGRVLVFQYIVGINKQAKIPTAGKKKATPKTAEMTCEKLILSC